MSVVEVEYDGLIYYYSTEKMLSINRSKGMVN